MFIPQVHLQKLKCPINAPRKRLYPRHVSRSKHTVLELVTEAMKIGKLLSNLPLHAHFIQLITNTLVWFSFGATHL